MYEILVPTAAIDRLNADAGRADPELDQRQNEPHEDEALEADAHDEPDET
jgi:hypothetical protein